MPPYVTTGWVVVGGEVVVVVVGKIGTGVGYVVLVARADATSADEVVDVMVSVVGHEADGEGIMGDVNGSKADVLFAAGYSLATTTPMSAAAPEAAMRDAGVRRTRAWVRRLVSGEWRFLGCLTCVAGTVQSTRLHRRG